MILQQLLQLIKSASEDYAVLLGRSIIAFTIKRSCFMFDIVIHDFMLEISNQNFDTILKKTI